MNCFDWHNCSSEYLDGDLEESRRLDAENHLKSCVQCMQHFKHYGLILSALADQPKSKIPPHIKKSPFSAIMPRVESARMSLSQWERIPWYIRVLLEASGIVAFVLLFVISSPKIRSFYERNFNRNMNELKDTLAANDPETDTAGVEGADPNVLLPLEKGTGATESENSTSTPTKNGQANPNSSLTSILNEQAPPDQPGTDTVAGEDEEESNKPAVRRGQSQLWRFTLKTVSPDELRPQVIGALRGLKIAPSTPGMQGTQVPGGIEFDMILPQGIVPEIKKALERVIAPSAASGNNAPLGSEVFSWYKVKSRKPLPPGKSKVVIWLSQPN